MSVSKIYVVLALFRVAIPASLINHNDEVLVVKIHAQWVKSP